MSAASQRRPYLKALLGAIVSVAAFSGCRRSAGSYHGDALVIDDRYAQVIQFESLDLQIPLGADAYIRLDPPVANTEEHLHLVLRELRVVPTALQFTNPGQNGMQVHLRFRDGKQCSFIWAKNDADPRLVKGRTEHEKYHAVMRLKPAAIQTISARISHLGFALNLADYEEELAATIVEILTIHREGVPLENLSGSEEVTKAVDLLHAAKVNSSAPTPSAPQQPSPPMGADLVPPAEGAPVHR